jgi:threonylcarbamoyladenosine tRNA methylthiotransferase MtaB
MPRVSFYTLGCKLNQAETAMMAEDFVRNGYEIVRFKERADGYVVNTCTVTAKSDYQCRQALRRAINATSDAIVVAVGCYSQIKPKELSDIRGVDLVLGSNNKFEIVQHVNELVDSQASRVLIEPHRHHESFTAPNPGQFLGRTRAFLKIQDGCNAGCTYCAVPLARGPSRSAYVEDVVNRAQQLVQRGFKEIVLTGVHVGRFEEGSDNSANLVALLQLLENTDGLARIRISSLDPHEITEELIDVIASSDKICHHLHIPLQSGNDDILRVMGRGYTVSEYSSIIERIFKVLPNVGMGTDVIVGFPGETLDQFQNTLFLIRNIPISYLHVFKYSRRPGTAAAKLSDNIPSAEKNNRSQQLRELGQFKKQEFYKRQLGKQLRVLFERPQNGYMTGWSDNYSRVAVSLNEVTQNELGIVRINQIKNNLALGTLISSFANA